MASNPWGASGTTIPTDPSQAGLDPFNPATGKAISSFNANNLTQNTSGQAAGSAASNLTTVGANVLGQSAEALDPYLSNLEKIYSGDRTATLEAAAPQVAQVSSQYDAAYKAAQQNAPRGGGRNAQLNAIPFQKASAITSTLETERQQAGQQLGQVGTQLAGLGLQAEEGGTQALTSLFGSLTNQQTQTNSSFFGALGDLGEGLVGLL
jgi:hypothetical protein